MATSLHQDTPQTAAVSSRNFSTFTSNPTGAAASAPVLARDTIRVRFTEDGWQAVHLSIATFADGAHIIACVVDGELARIWDYGRAGYVIQIKSVSTPDGWHTVSASEGCGCLNFQHRGHCRHCAAGQHVEAVFLAFQYAERVRATNAGRAAAGKAALSQYDWEGAVA